jgi:16S rRNA (adenine1518-N6/adenine1519-N6)-dimethyltransferase
VSVKVAFWSTAQIVGLVSPSVFLPRPNVESALVAVVRHEPPDAEPEAVFALVRTAFGQRRKMLRRSLAGVVTAEQLSTARIDPTARPEQLDVADWCRLAAVTTS